MQNLYPLVSIITVNFNGSKFLENCILSVLNQSYKYIEYIIIDGGSKDESLSVIKKYENNINYWHSRPDRGIYDAMNIGIEKSKGEIIGILNSDDYLYESAIKDVVESLQFNKNSSYTVGPIDLCDLDGSIYKKLKIDNITIRNKNRLLKMPAPHMSMYVLRNIFKEVGLYDISYKYCSDYDFLLKIMEKNYIPAELKNTIGVFRRGGRGGSLSTWLEAYTIRNNYKINLLLNIKLFLISALKSIISDNYFRLSKLIKKLFLIINFSHYKK